MKFTFHVETGSCECLKQKTTQKNSSRTKMTFSIPTDRILKNPWYFNTKSIHIFEKMFNNNVESIVKTKKFYTYVRVWRQYVFGTDGCVYNLHRVCLLPNYRLNPVTILRYFNVQRRQLHASFLYCNSILLGCEEFLTIRSNFGWSELSLFSKMAASMNSWQGKKKLGFQKLASLAQEICTL